VGVAVGSEVLLGTGVAVRVRVGVFDASGVFEGTDVLVRVGVALGCVGDVGLAGGVVGVAVGAATVGVLVGLLPSGYRLSMPATSRADRLRRTP
jgi:hypothetical protein